MNQTLKNKTILITGAAGGLGSELSSLCATVDCNTVMLDVDRKGMESVYDHIVEQGLTEPVLYPIDLASATPEKFEELVSALEAEFGGLDGLIHCAARFEALRPLEQVSPPEWLLQMQVNINACWLLSVACLPLLRKSATGSLYFLLEDMDRMSGAFWGAYGVSKHALKALTSQFAAELYILGNSGAGDQSRTYEDPDAGQRIPWRRPWLAAGNGCSEDSGVSIR